MSSKSIKREGLTNTYTSVTTFDAGDLAGPPAVGEVWEDGDGNKYKFVKHTGGEARVVGDFVSYSYTNGVSNEVDQYESGVNNTGIEQMAGVCMGAIPASGFGWIQIKGYNATCKVETTTDIAIGDSLKLVTAQDYCVQDSAIGTESTYAAHAVALEARTDNDTGTIACRILCDQ